MKMLSRDNYGIKYLLSLIDVYSKYSRVGFIEIINNFNRKPNKLWADKGK